MNTFATTKAAIFIVAHHEKPTRGKAGGPRAPNNFWDFISLYKQIV